MDYTSVSNGSPTNPPHATLPPDPPDASPPPPHPRRHTRYSAASTNVSSPHVVINTRRRRSPHHRSAAHTPMNAPPPALRSSHTSALTEPVPPLPPPSGQDHDRMETDEESEHYESQDDGVEPEDGEVPAQVQAPNGINSAPQIEDAVVVMDTAPDQTPAAAEGARRTAVDQGSQTNPTVEGVTVPGLLSMTLPEGWTLPPGTTPTVSQNAHGQLQLIVSDSMLDSGILRQELDEARRVEAQTDPARGTDQDRPENARQQPRREDRGDEDDEGSDSDESMDEGDHPYWAHFKPDTSVPDESEIAAIEEGEEHSGTDHEYWEKMTFEPLDDPEYVPSDVGRITWTVEGNHGTPEKPNREEIMRSPSVLIGGLYWNIKYYPRGNDGTDYMSVYIECSPKPDEEKARSKRAALDDAVEEKIPVEDANPIVDHGENASNPVPEATTEQPNGNPTSETPEVDMDASSILPPDEDKAAGGDDAEPEAPWSVAAQISCVVYNPAEPR